ncbi:unnamed protein product [Dicrocoelium dendriticum]|nr:unnamed protein product [Dicrocoelium dendriticum]
MLLINFPVYFVVLSITSAIAGYICWVFYNKRLKRGVKRVHRVPTSAVGGVRRRAPNVAVRRRLAAGTHVPEHSTDEQLVQRTGDEFQPHDDEPDGSGVSESHSSKIKVGTKKAAKLAEKERRKEEREAEERYREHQRKLEDQKIAKRKEAEMAEEMALAEAAAAEARRLAEEAERERIEYEKLKSDFIIEEEGIEVAERSCKAEEEFNARFISFIRDAKVIPIEHLALEFNLKTETCIERLKTLIASGQLTGLLDDRGKFVYITSDEYEAVAQFIEKRGRVTIRELVENGPKLLNLRTSGR